MRFLLYQVAIIGLIWSGMFFFMDDLYEQGQIIFYVVTSWLLFLIVLLLKEWFKSRRNQDQKK